VFGVGYIFKTKKVFFTVNGREIDKHILPLKLQSQILYPSISLGSREMHKVEINLGAKRFTFDLDNFILNKYYYELYN
jgi:hypothetical protein